MEDRKGGIVMGIEDMKLAGTKNISFSLGLHPNLMDIFDPLQSYIQKLDQVQLGKLIRVGLQYQNKLLNNDMSRIKIVQEAIGEVDKVIEGIGGPKR
jgi:hypothetical protein